VRQGNLKTNKAITLYQGNSAVISLAANASGTSIISGHQDCTLCRYNFEEGSNPPKLV